MVGPGTPSMEEETVGQQISWPDKTALWDPRQAKILSLGAVPYEGGSKASQQISIARSSGSRARSKEIKQHSVSRKGSGTAS